MTSNAVKCILLKRGNDDARLAQKQKDNGSASGSCGGCGHCSNCLRHYQHTQRHAGNEGRSSWSGHYVLLDGTMQKSVYADGDTLDVAVETQSGTISIAITDTAGNVIFDEQDIGTESFAVEASGKVVVRITADHHKGSFQISG